ncbi:MAG: UvrD-helicase domain-containing protein, partial [Phototrophicaceae bacterium]
VLAAMGEDIDALSDLAHRLAEARPLRCGLLTARKTHALHIFAAAFLPAYAAAKQARGWLDFDDLIMRMRRLLTAPSIAQWVLFRLDGGIDHILVDEAQDTAQREQRISEITAEYQSAETVDELLRITLDELGRSLGASRGMVRLGKTASTPNGNGSNGHHPNGGDTS